MTFARLTPMEIAKSDFNYFMLLTSFYTPAPWKYQKTRGFLMFSGSIEGNIGMKWIKDN